MSMRSAAALARALRLGVRLGSARGAGAGLVRVAAHVAAWSPFLVSVADSLRGGWHAVGDGALIALGSWATFSRHVYLVGQPTELHRGLHDLGPLEYWLLAIPVHLDPARGLLWGAALLCLAAVSMAIEAAWSVLGEVGGLLASGVILAMIAWMPTLALRPYWNPYFAAVWFLAAVAAGWAVMSGHRRWWPALVVSASIAAQTHLMFALASAGLVLVALIVAVANRSRVSTGYRWVIAGLVVGQACWVAPFYQQLTHSPGNMSALIHAGTAGRQAGLGFAVKALAAFTEPPPMWWQGHLGQRPDLYRVIEARPAGFAVAAFAIAAVVLTLAIVKLRCRWLASLAAVSLLVSAAAVMTFSGIPLIGRVLGRVSYLILVMFPAGVLIWLTAGSAIVLIVWNLIASRRARTAGRAPAPAGQPGTSRTRLAAYGAWAAAAALVVLASLFGVGRASGYSGADLNSDQVGVAARVIERALPARRIIALSVAAESRSERYKVTMGLLWALTGQGYDPDISRLGPTRPIPQVAVLVRGSKVTVHITPRLRRSVRSGRRARPRPLPDAACHRVASCARARR